MPGSIALGRLDAYGATRTGGPTSWHLPRLHRGSLKKLYVSAFPCGVSHPPAANHLTVELAVLKELSQELARLFGYQSEQSQRPKPQNGRGTHHLIVVQAQFRFAIAEENLNCGICMDICRMALV